MIDISCGIDTDTDFGIASIPEMQVNDVQSVSRISVETILSIFESGISFDIAKNHTGVCMWKDGVVTTKGFAINMEYDRNDFMAEAKMRLNFKAQAKEILGDTEWEVCVIEDCYGGVNFETTRKLLALNCVVDELVLEGAAKIKNLYRFKEPEWIRDFRRVIKLGSKMDTKLECQGILEYMEFGFVVSNKCKSNAEKERIFYEDICDATGQLCSLALRLKSGKKVQKKSALKLSSVEVFYFEEEDEIYSNLDDCLFDLHIKYVPFEYSNIEEGILTEVAQNPGNLIGAVLPTSKLGTFGLKNNFEFYEQGFGILIFYDKKLKR